MAFNNLSTEELQEIYYENNRNKYSSSQLDEIREALELRDAKIPDQRKHVSEESAPAGDTDNVKSLDKPSEPIQQPPVISQNNKKDNHGIDPLYKEAFELWVDHKFVHKHKNPSENIFHKLLKKNFPSNEALPENVVDLWNIMNRARELPELTPVEEERYSLYNIRRFGEKNAAHQRCPNATVLATTRVTEPQYRSILDDWHNGIFQPHGDIWP